MFTQNSDNQKSNCNSEQPCSACNKSNVQFETLDQFSNWMDVQLAELEERYNAFETATSVRQHFSR
jgi:hypothetical protein